MSETRKCRKCEIVKETWQFQSLNNTCKECEKEQRENYDEGINADLSKVAYNSRFDIMAARDLLTDMGYDLNKPIYLQFNERMYKKYGITFGEGNKRGKYKKKG